MNQPQFSDDVAGRERLRELLDRWQAGALDERAVHEAAEALSESFPGDLPSYPQSEPRSIAIEVLSQLEILNWQLITRQDIPALLDFLGTRRGEEERGWERYQKYWDSVDFDRRLKELADNPYYSKSAPRTR